MSGLTRYPAKASKIPSSLDSRGDAGLSMYQTILVPVDGSEFSARALPVAVELARRTGATLHLALVHDPSSYIPFVPGEVAVPVYDAGLVSAQHDADLARLSKAAEALAPSGVRVVAKLLE